MNDKRFTLDELTEEVNKELKTKDLAATDSRQSKEFSARRIRGLAGENLISKPFKDGRNVHVNIKTPEYWKEKLLQLHKKHSHLNIHYSLDVIEDEKAEKPVSITTWEKIERK